ncbi:MAG: NADH-quinone oxidoreductase subunit J [Deltaproteobacteria bacterium]|nr:NADH-quinone oxidoreductase subunit J [Deltaproteobacteria bacterium]
MADRAELWIFLLFAIPLVIAAAGVVAARNPVNAAMSLVAAFFFLAGIYVLLVAHLVAFLQILVYAGAIMVVFLFVIMLLQLHDQDMQDAKLKAMQWGGIIGASGVLTVVALAIQQAGEIHWKAVPESFGTVKAVGMLLFTQYLLPFEATSLLLLVAIVGAVVVAKQRI